MFLQDGTKTGSTSYTSYIYVYHNGTSLGNSHGDVWTSSALYKTIDAKEGDVITIKGYSGTTSDSSQGYMCMYVN